MHATDLLPIFDWNTRDVCPSVVPLRMNFRVTDYVDRALAPLALVDVFITDAAKSAQMIAMDLGAIAPYLGAGSLIVLFDFDALHARGPRHAQAQHDPVRVRPAGPEDTALPGRVGLIRLLWANAAHPPSKRPW
jgi:hypothetical protein